MSYQKIIIKKKLNKEEKREEEEERDIQISLASFNSHTTKTLVGQICQIAYNFSNFRKKTLYIIKLFSYVAYFGTQNSGARIDWNLTT